MYKRKIIVKSRRTSLLIFVLIKDYFFFKLGDLVVESF